MFATDDFIGIKPSSTYTFVIFTCPVGVYYSSPINVKIEEFYTRASQGGVGRAKTAGNYGASLYPAKKANEEGFHQLIWTDGIEHKYIEESGTMNVMFVVDGILITPSEDSDTILKGVTKRSVIEIAQHWGISVEERKITVDEIITALKEGRVSEVFGAGTAATIAPIAKIGFRGELYELPAVKTREISNKVSRYLSDVKVGSIEDEMNWCVTV
jgi:branched-chain amino acid aminotransferase